MAVLSWLIGAGAMYLAQHQLQSMINETLNDLNWRGMMIDTTNQEITMLNNEIAEKYEEYKQLYNKYNENAQKQLNYTFEITDTSIRQVVLIGVTGSGKSLFANRLSGYQGDDDQNGYFSVSDDIDSVTQTISKLIVYNLHSVNLSILDTPGIYDSNDNDMLHRHQLIEYLKGSGGVNAFLLVMKKNRFSQNIQNMLKDFQQTFGNEFWSHLIFVINFWNDRERKNWENWKESFRNKIRAEFELEDSEKYPLHVIGLNNFGSYRLEIRRDLIPNIPSKRLTSDSFMSPLDALETRLAEKYDELRELGEHWTKMQATVEGICDEFWGLFKGNLLQIHFWMEKKTFCELCDNPYLSYVYKVKYETEFTSEECNESGTDFLHEFIEEFYYKQCLKRYQKTVEIIQKIKENRKMDKRGDERKSEEASHQHASINYNTTKNLFYKYNWLLDEQGQHLLNCMNSTGKYHKRQIYSFLNKGRDNYAIMKCKADTTNYEIYDDGARFLVL